MDGSLVTLEENMDTKSGGPAKSKAHYKKVVKGKMMGVAFVKRADQQRYAKLITSIRDQHSFKKDVCPKSLHEAYKLLENHISAGGGINNDTS